MNSLEFINQEIEFLEDMISMDLSLVEDDFDLQEIYKKQQRLRHLQQIKTELEAWEVVKEQLCLRIADHEDKIFGTKYGLQVEYDNIIPLTDEEVKSFKKALEVEENVD